jgi:hypothetical protein
MNVVDKQRWATSRTQHSSPARRCPPAAARCSVREGKVRYVYPWAAGRGCGIAPSDQRRPAVTLTSTARPPLRATKAARMRFQCSRRRWSQANPA